MELSPFFIFSHHKIWEEDEQNCLQRQGNLLARRAAIALEEVLEMLLFPGDAIQDQNEHKEENKG